MRKVIPIVLLLIFLASPSYAVSSPPWLLEKLDVMFEWVKQEMDVHEVKRPPVFISSPQIFFDICKYNTDGTEDFDCEDVIGLYFVKPQIIHVSKEQYPSVVDSTIIHEMVHHLQRFAHGLIFFMADENGKFLEDQANGLGREYVRRMYGIVTR
jgi:hypothetical protein